MRVLLVGGSLTAIGRIALNADGVVIDSTDDGKESLEVVRRSYFSVLVLDLTTPNIDGCDVVRRWRRAQVDTPIVVLAAAGRFNLRTRLFSAGADDVIERPFDPPSSRGAREQSSIGTAVSRT